MHEVGVASSIIKTVTELANGAKIKKVAISVGTISGVEPRSLEFALESIKEDTLASGAEFEINIIETVGKCVHCSKESKPSSFLSVCEHCGFLTLDIISGKDLTIDYIDVED